ncbi:MAG: hypothetical protein IJE72_04245, partial [Clostridia bacterium]|nr:hypothetical protein [Clostridia bacterium]
MTIIDSSVKIINRCENTAGLIEFLSLPRMHRGQRPEGGALRMSANISYETMMVFSVANGEEAV